MTVVTTDLNWRSQTCYSLLGHPIRIRSTSNSFAVDMAHLMRSFPRCTGDGPEAEMTLSVFVGSTAGPPRHAVYRDQLLVAHTGRYSHLFRLVEWQLDLFLAEAIDEYVLLHAGVVAQDDVALLLPGGSGSGKTTLTTALLLSGYGYLSDELAAILPATGTVHPFPKPLTLKSFSPFSDRIDPGASVLRQRSGEQDMRYLHPEMIGAPTVVDPLPIHFVVFPHYTAAAKPQLQTLSPEQAMRRLLNNTVNLSRVGGVGLQTVAELARRSRCFALTAGPLQPTVDLLTQEVAGQGERSLAGDEPPLLGSR